MPTKTTPNFISDEFDGSSDFTSVRTKVRNMGGKVTSRPAQDNSYKNIDKGDWVQLDDFDANIGIVNQVYETGDSYVLVVRLWDGTFESVDSYSVSRLDMGTAEFMANKKYGVTDKQWDAINANYDKVVPPEPEHHTIEYQGGEWRVAGQKVQRGHTWYKLRNAAGEKNIILDKTFRVVGGHETQSHPFYMPDGPYYDFQGKTWFINDMFKDGDVSYADIVNKKDRLDHRVVRYADIAKHKIQAPIHEVHWATMRRRLPTGGISDTTKIEGFDFSTQPEELEDTSAFDFDLGEIQDSSEDELPDDYTPPTRSSSMSTQVSRPSTPRYQPTVRYGAPVDTGEIPLDWETAWDYYTKNYYNDNSYDFDSKSAIYGNAHSANDFAQIHYDILSDCIKYSPFYTNGKKTAKTEPRKSLESMRANENKFNRDNYGQYSLWKLFRREEGPGPNPPMNKLGSVIHECATKMEEFLNAPERLGVLSHKAGRGTRRYYDLQIQSPDGNDTSPALNLIKEDWDNFKRNTFINIVYGKQNITAHARSTNPYPLGIDRKVWAKAGSKDHPGTVSSIQSIDPGQLRNITPVRVETGIYRDVLSTAQLIDDYFQNYDTQTLFENNGARFTVDTRWYLKYDFNVDEFVDARKKFGSLSHQEFKYKVDLHQPVTNVEKCWRFFIYAWIKNYRIFCNNTTQHPVFHAWELCDFFFAMFSILNRFYGGLLNQRARLTPDTWEFNAYTIKSLREGGLWAAISGPVRLSGIDPQVNERWTFFPPPPVHYDSSPYPDRSVQQIKNRLQVYFHLVYGSVEPGWQPGWEIITGAQPAEPPAAKDRIAKDAVEALMRMVEGDKRLPKMEQFVRDTNKVVFYDAMLNDQSPYHRALNEPVLQNRIWNFTTERHGFMDGLKESATRPGPQYHSVHLLFPPDRPHWKVAYIYRRWYYYISVARGFYRGCTVKKPLLLKERLKLQQLEHLLENHYVNYLDGSGWDFGIDGRGVRDPLFAIDPEKICIDVEAALDVFDEKVKMMPEYVDLRNQVAKISAQARFDASEDEPILMSEEKDSEPRPPLEPGTSADTIDTDDTDDNRPLIRGRRDHTRSPSVLPMEDDNMSLDHFKLAFIPPPGPARPLKRERSSSREPEDVPDPQVKTETEEKVEEEKVDEDEVPTRVTDLTAEGTRTRVVVRGKRKLKKAERPTSYYLLMGGVLLVFAYMLVE